MAAQSAVSPLVMVEAVDMTAARDAAGTTQSHLDSIGDVVSDFAKEFKKLWQTISSSRESEEKRIDEVKALLLEVDQHEVSVNDVQVGG